MASKPIFLYNISYSKYLSGRIISQIYIIAPPKATHLSNVELFSLGYVGVYLKPERFNNYDKRKIDLLVHYARTKMYMENL